MAGLVEVGLPMLKAGTPELFWPAQPKQMFLTGYFSAKLFLKLHQAEGFLLHRHSSFR
jgi:hypothetical protein